MMGALWQDAAVALVAAVALAWLVVRRLRARRRGGVCEDCPVAASVPGARPAPTPEVLIAIGEPPRRGAAGERGEGNPVP